MEEMAFEVCTISFTVKDRHRCLKYKKGDRLSKRWRAVRSCIKTGCFVDLGVGVRLVWHCIWFLLFSLLVFWMQAFFTVFPSLEKIRVRVVHSWIACVGFILVQWFSRHSFLVRLLSFPSASPILSSLQMKRCYHLSTPTFIRSSPLSDGIRSAFSNVFSSGFPFFLIHEFLFQTGRWRAAEYRMWWILFLALRIIILPFLSCQPFAPLSMSWSCLNQPLQVSRMEVIKFISGLIAVAFSSFGCFELVGSEDKGSSRSDVAPSFSIDSMITVYNIIPKADFCWFFSIGTGGSFLFSPVLGARLQQRRQTLTRFNCRAIASTGSRRWWHRCWHQPTTLEEARAVPWIVLGWTRKHFGEVLKKAVCVVFIKEPSKETLDIELQSWCRCLLMMTVWMTGQELSRPLSQASPGQDPGSSDCQTGVSIILILDLSHCVSNLLEKIR